MDNGQQPNVQGNSEQSVGVIGEVTAPRTITTTLTDYVRFLVNRNKKSPETVTLPNKNNVGSNATAVSGDSAANIWFDFDNPCH